MSFPSQSRFKEIVDKFPKLDPIMVLGDVGVDKYTFGTVDRISPEAPVPVIDVTKKEKGLGGAANVALNLKALGAEPILCSVIGEDKSSAQFLKLLQEENLINTCIIQSSRRRTTVKQRVIGNNHLLLRIDTEDKFDLDNWENDQLFHTIKDNLKDIDVVIFQDYNKGILNQGNIESLVTLCKKEGIPTAVDPKKKNFLSYLGVDLFKPNLKELKEGLNLDLDLKVEENLIEAETQLRALIKNKLSMITLSELGVFVADEHEKSIVPAHIRNISDVSGAGDSVISVAALCLALNLPKEQIASLSNLAGGLVCEENGVVPVNLKNLILEAQKAGI